MKRMSPLILGSCLILISTAFAGCLDYWGEDGQEVRYRVLITFDSNVTGNLQLPAIVPESGPDEVEPCALYPFDLISLEVVVSENGSKFWDIEFSGSQFCLRTHFFLGSGEGLHHPDIMYSSVNGTLTTYYVSRSCANLDLDGEQEIVVGWQYLLVRNEVC